jgi:hypothetical protein
LEKNWRRTNDNCDSTNVKIVSTAIIDNEPMDFYECLECGTKFAD